MKKPATETVVKRYEALLRMSASQSPQTPKDLARKLASELHSLLDFDSFEVLVYKQDTSEVLWRCMDIDQTSWLEARAQETPAWWVRQNQQRLIITDWNQDDRFSWLRDALRERGVEIRFICVLPLTTPQSPMGVLLVANKHPREYSEEEVRFLSFLADGLAYALGNAFNFEASCQAKAALELQNARLKLLLELTNQVTSNLHLRELLRTISASVRQTMDCDMAGVSLLDPASDQFRIYAIDSPDSRGFIQEESTIPVEGLAVKALETLRPVFRNSLTLADSKATMYQRVVAEGIKSTCLVPLVSREIARIVRETIGKLNTSPNGGREYDKKQRQDISRTARKTADELNGSIAASHGTEYDEKRRQEITRILIETKGRVGGPEGAAALAGLHRTTLLSRMRKLGIDPREFST